MSDSAPGYFLVLVDVTDPDRYAVYQKEVEGVVARFGGRILTGADSRRRLVEGDWNPERLFLIEFPSYEAAERFYFSDDYQRAVKHRLAASNSHGFLLERQDG